MIFAVDQNNSLTIDIKNGGKILELKLSGHIVIKSDQNIPRFLSTGSYLMFPWVNRLRQFEFASPFKDNKNFPLHGLCASQPRKYIVSKLQNKLVVEMSLQIENKLVPPFKQVFSLEKGKLKIQFTAQKTNPNQPFCFGYHPYFQIDNYELSQLQMESDVNYNLQLDENLLPVYPFKRSKKQITTLNSYDDLFEGGSYFQLKGPKNQYLRISSNLGYWQVYTPDKNRIAIQPMSFTGNVYEIYQKQEGKLELIENGEINICIKQKTD